jgi:hypothetical protein
MVTQNGGVNLRRENIENLLVELEEQPWLMHNLLVELEEQPWLIQNP